MRHVRYEYFIKISLVFTSCAFIEKFSLSPVQRTINTISQLMVAVYAILELKTNKFSNIDFISPNLSIKDTKHTVFRFHFLIFLDIMTHLTFILILTNFKQDFHL